MAGPVEDTFVVQLQVPTSRHGLPRIELRPGVVDQFVGDPVVHQVAGVVAEDADHRRYRHRSSAGSPRSPTDKH